VKSCKKKKGGSRFVSKKKQKGKNSKTDKGKPLSRTRAARRPEKKNHKKSKSLGTIKKKSNWLQVEWRTREGKKRGRSLDRKYYIGNP